VTLELRDIHKAFPQRGAAASREAVALRGVSLTVPLHGYTCVMGASGCGKTTLLRIVAGLERPERGEVILDGRSITALPAEKRPVHTLFQGYALFPHLSAWENVAFAPRLAGLPGRQLRERVEALLRTSGSRRGCTGGVRRRCRAGSGSGWRWRGRWRGNRRWCCSTSRWRRSTGRCARGCASC
jgi:ABC-type Fe3+/spermidine/putrescine transport system ATPase subunit